MFQPFKCYKLRWKHGTTALVVGSEGHIFASSNAQDKATGIFNMSGFFPFRGSSVPLRSRIVFGMSPLNDDSSIEFIFYYLVAIGLYFTDGVLLLKSDCADKGDILQPVTYGTSQARARVEGT